MSDIDRIYQKYIAVFYEVDGGGTWIDLSAVRYALRAALREMADGVMRPAPALDMRQVEAVNGQIERLNDWLFEYAHDLAHDPYTDTAGAMIAAADRLRGHVAKLRVELATAIDERNAADGGCADVEAWLAQVSSLVYAEVADGTLTLRQGIAKAHDNAYAMLDNRNNESRTEIAGLRQQLAQMDADNAALTKELAILRSYVTAQKIDATNGLIDDFDTVIMNPPAITAAAAAVDGVALSWPGDLADWVEGLEKGRHDWRKLAKSVRWQLIANVVCQVRDSVRFDAHRPQWMSTSRAAAMTFGDGRWDNVVARAQAGEVAL